MSEAAKPKADDRPQFQPGTMVTTESMIVDSNGVAWWVRPDSMAIRRVYAPVSQSDSDD
jgi:hypothetical protein